MAMKATAKDGTVLPDELLEANTNYMAAITQDYGSANKVTFLRQLGVNVTKTNMKLVKEYLNSKFGQRPVTRNTTVTVVSDKKINCNECTRRPM